MKAISEIRRRTFVSDMRHKSESAAASTESMPMNIDDEVGVAEARRRDLEMDRDSAASLITWEELLRGLGR